MRTVKASELDKLTVSGKDQMIVLFGKLLVSLDRSVASITTALGRLKPPEPPENDRTAELLAQALVELKNNKKTVAVASAPPRAWTFSIKRDSDGFIQEIIAKPQ